MFGKFGWVLLLCFGILGGMGLPKAFGDRQALPASRFEKLSGVGTDKKQPKAMWDTRYNSATYVYGKAPAEFLAENFHFLPPNANILDMGMGEGRNAVFLAKKGYKVVGIDISSVAVKKAQLLAKEFGVKIESIVASLKEYSIPDNSFDAIICFYYVDRSLNEKIMKWLRPGGVLIYESYTSNQANVSGFEPARYNVDYLRPQELLTMFPDSLVLKYVEPLHRDEFTASIILQKKAETLGGKTSKNQISRKN